MQGLMQSQPLLLTDILEYATLAYGDTEIVSWEGTELFRYNYAQAATRARALHRVLPSSVMVRVTSWAQSRGPRTDTMS